MKRILIVSPYQSVAMQRMSRPLQTSTRFQVDIATEIRPGYDLYYHIPFHTLPDVPPDGSHHVMLYTHMNPPDRQMLMRSCARADAVVCMSYKGRAELMALGVPIEKLAVIYAGADHIEKMAHVDRIGDQLRVGVAGAEQPNGRKRSHLLIDLAWMMDLSRIRFIIVGSGMGPIAQMMVNVGADIQYYEGLNDSEMGTFYSWLDLFLVTGYIEGGPLTVLESLARGIPVLSPPVGYAYDLLPKYCIYHSIEDLVSKLTLPPTTIPQRVLDDVALMTWDKYVTQHESLFESVLNHAQVHLHGRQASADSVAQHTGGSADPVPEVS